ncbi:tubulointerstitial nephritis antigen-like [Babylonia areolata]|uniref:tubulointerstitial nephritis antigen-like n=1 Tax=Babylonia areolata TaxID=304850 RepID=UPI003FD65F70
MRSLHVAYTLAVVVVTLCVPTTWSFFAEWGPDLAGPWCARRPAGQDCCVGRDDNCAVPILGTECYCDIFCNLTSYDCCPDYWAHCHGVTTAAPTTARPTTLPTPRPTRPPVVQCERNGVYYRPGETVKDNCNECTCELYVRGGPRRYVMRCTQNVCLLRPDLIQAVNRGRYTWRAGNHTGLWGMTLSDGVRYRLGTFPLERDVLRMTPIKVRQDESLPEMFDARRRWPDKLHPIRDQGNCAASWAFSTTAVASDRLSIESDGAIREELSAQHMLSCDTDGQGGCTGGKADRAWFFLRRYGVVTEACYPYDSGKSNEKGECRLPVRQRGGECPSGIRYKREKRYKASPPYRIRPLEREIMKEIMDNGPVQAIFKVQEDFFMYQSGVYQYTGLTRNEPSDARLSGYHSVRILGWGMERTPEGDIVKYWICANSWGPEWGENGYFRIVRGVNANDIETYIVGAWGKVTGDVMLRQLLTEQRRRRLQQTFRAGGGGQPRSLRHLSGRSRRRRRHHRGGEGSRRALRQLTTGRRGRRRGRGNSRKGRLQKKGGRRRSKLFSSTSSSSSKKSRKGRKSRRNSAGRVTSNNNHKLGHRRSRSSRKQTFDEVVGL